MFDHPLGAQSLRCSPNLPGSLRAWELDMIVWLSPQALRGPASSFIIGVCGAEPKMVALIISRDKV